MTMKMKNIHKLKKIKVKNKKLLRKNLKRLSRKCNWAKQQQDTIKLHPK
jgi:hypothetical protein